LPSPWGPRRVVWTIHYQCPGRQIGLDRYRDKDAGERLRAMNYDIHMGHIAGLPGRIAAFLARLVAASLPIAGALIWWNRG
jgi:uncharacterized iron-regulated membrane protein